MPFIADLHIHSRFSRATSKELNLEHLHKWAQLKGVQVVGTGDFTHPQWLDELAEKLEPAVDGLFKLKKEYADQTQPGVFRACESEVRFILSAEISNIYKKNDRVRKNHHVLLSPSLATARKIQERLDKIGNIRSDGRPILGLDAKNLLELVLEIDEQVCFIPAHIWTPWFSVLGSKSGFDSIEECFEELSQHIYAVETGLSSDPPMNWRVSSLDKYTLVSNSDAHSPQKLAREANIFKCELSYPAMIQAMRSGDPALFGGTIEFFPEEGKYHFDGHRKCNVRLSPEETLANHGLCPVCGKEVTLGVSYRVEMLADRPLGEKPAGKLPYVSLIPLPEIVAEVKNVGPTSRSVLNLVDTLLSKLGAELTILREVALDDIRKIGGSLLAEAIRRMRTGELQFDAGYDGEFGTIKIFTEEERKKMKTKSLFIEAEFAQLEIAPALAATTLVVKDASEEFSTAPPASQTNRSKHGNEESNRYGLNDQQLQAVQTTKNNLIIVAGPGTGKTRTLTYRIAYLIQEMGVTPEQILAVTFTNKAAEEMIQRLSQLLDESTLAALTIKTFHSFGAMILKAECSLLNYRASFSIYNESDKKQVLKQLAPQLSITELHELADRISAAKNKLLSPTSIEGDDGFTGSYQKYQQTLQLHQAFDFDDLIYQPVLLFQENAKVLKKYQQQFKWISVDEYQDINYAQYTLLRLLMKPKTNLCVIGDPDQAIYGFRGADHSYFKQFKQDFSGAIEIDLEKNYRSNQTILSASSQVISKNPDRQQIPLWSTIVNDVKLEIFQTPTEKSEAETIVHQIEKIVGATSFFSVDSGRAGHDDLPEAISFGDIAILYRLHAQLPPLEEALIRSGIPYQTLGETPFWEQPEVRELVSYLRVLQNPHTDLDLYRILMSQPRGFHEQTLQVLLNYKKINQLSLWQALEKSQRISSLSEIQKQPLNYFMEMIKSLQQQVSQLPLVELIDEVIARSGMKSFFKNDNKHAYYWKAIREQAEKCNIELASFLEKVMLQKETDLHDPNAEKVTVMSLHASKGLEFPVVFISGCEEGLLPYRRQTDNVEEERRLFYVGMTRAKFKLMLTYTSSRFLFGERKSNYPSRFISDIEAALKESRRAQLKKPKETKDNPDDSQMSLF